MTRQLTTRHGSVSIELSEASLPGPLLRLLVTDLPGDTSSEMGKYPFVFIKASWPWLSIGNLGILKISHNISQEQNLTVQFTK